MMASAKTCNLVASGEAISMDDLPLGDLALVAESSLYTQDRYAALQRISSLLSTP
jgi:hypothetical protein